MAHTLVVHDVQGFQLSASREMQGAGGVPAYSTTLEIMSISGPLTLHMISNKPFLQENPNTPNESTEAVSEVGSEGTQDSLV